MMLQLPKPYLLFLGATTNAVMAKTAFGLKDWAGPDCVAQWRLPGGTVSTGLPDLRPADAFAAGARSIVIGVAPVGGKLQPDWVEPLVEALEAGLDIVSGMHDRLESSPRIAETAARLGRKLINVRTPAPPSANGTGDKRTGRRLLTVGTDCALGKKYTALVLTRAFRARGLDADFRATGQTGIMIAGEGVPLDAVVADFLSGYAEALSPDASPDHWDVIEGQGSLFHPAYAAVTLGLVHGSQPDVMVLCHEPGRTVIDGVEDYPIPPLTEAIADYVRAARLTNKAARVAGISLNTSALDEAGARAALAAATAETGLPAADPIRGLGLEVLVEACLAG
jgi:uncharacterized NAD-dependent epimerase/dehydratase family protein